MTQKPISKKRITRQGFFKVVILILSAILTFLSLVLPDAFSQSSYPMEIGDVSAQDILAPYSLSFESEVLTEQSRQEAANTIYPVYLPADPSIGRHQVEQLRKVLYFITSVRQDDYAISDEKLADIQLIESCDISTEIGEQVLQISDTSWDAIQLEATSVLEQAMRNTLRENDIFAAKRNIPSLIDFSLPVDQSNIIIELVQPFVVPNSLFSKAQTDAAISEARQSVEPVTHSFISGETLVRRGQIISDIEWESLQRYGLIQASDRTSELISAAILTLLMSFLVFFYFSNQKDNHLYPLKTTILIAVTFLVFLALTRFVIIDRTVLPYVFPIVAFTLTIYVIFNFEIAAFFSLILAVLTAYGMNNGLELTLYYVLPAILGILILGKAKQIASFFIAGITIGLAGIALIFCFRLPDAVTDWIGIATLSGASLINGIGSAGLTLLLQYGFSQLLGTTTTLQLLDISRPDHPLLKQMLRSAPGSYQHSLQVANLAEQAAEAIGADGLLVRVGAIYHDCGKSINPRFFIENQISTELDPHDEIDPVVSAQTIINHVRDGVELARKYHLPDRIIDFVREHHGTMYTHYQYTQAVDQSGDPAQVDKSLFTYPGPRPQSRETALLMLADGTEARARAEVPKTEEELRSLVDTVVDFYQRNNQLDDTNLTLRDLQEVKNSFCRSLNGTYHPRMKYPDLDNQNDQ